MVTKSKIAVIAAVLGLISASPALAQSFDSDFGSGNELPSYYDQSGALHSGNVQQHSQVAVHRSGLNAFASVSRAASSSDSPANTGGGSIGYNEMLQNDQW